MLGSINTLDAKEEFGGLRSEDIDRRRERKELERVLQLKEISWRQKSRALWLRERTATQGFSTEHPIFAENSILWLRW